jgi:hypothetical protein
VEAPAFNRHGGRIEAGFELQMGAPAGTVYYTLDGSDPRLTGGAVSPAARVAGEATGGTTILRSGDPCRAMVPPDGAIGLAWTMPGFADAAWKPGTTGVGFERTTGYEALIGTDMGTEMDGINASVYVRIPFTVAAPAGITGLTLRMKYDDGFAAYLNGVLVASSNAPAGLTWNSEATTANPDANAIVFQEFDITAHIGDLRAGTNILALHGLNSTSTSSDMLVLPEVVAAGGGGGAGAGAGSVQLEGTTTVKARALDGDWSALTEAFFHVDLPLRITEVMYHPADEEPGSPFDADDFEFLELQNIGAGPLDLRGFRLTGGIEHDFTGSALVLLPGEVVLVVKSLAAFAERYPFLGALVSGEYSGNLGNAGERLRLVGPQEEPLLDFEYSALWEPETDGLGYSLVAADPGADPSAWGTAAGWRRSAAPGGSPGEVESGPPPVGGLQLPGDVNQDAVLDISDAVRGLFLLFVDAELPLPCSGDDPHAGGNLALLDVTGDGRADLSDPVAILNFLFQGGAAPALGTSCRRLTGCPDACR